MSQTSESKVWVFIRAEEFAKAEGAVRELIDDVDDDDHRELCRLFGLLGSILNSLGKHDEATSALRDAVAHELQLADAELGTHRYFLAHQYLNVGEPEQALALIDVVAPGVGHLQCLLQTTAAKAFWALGRTDEARRAAAEALAAAPVDERSEVLSELRDMLNGE